MVLWVPFTTSMLNKGFFYNFMATTQSPDAQNQLLKSKTNMPIQERSYLEKLENINTPHTEPVSKWSSGLFTLKAMLLFF